MNVRHAFHLTAWTSAGEKVRSPRSGPRQRKAIFTGKAEGRPRCSRLSRSGSARMACPCSPASPHVLTPQMPDSRSQHRGEWRRCTLGTPRGLGAAVGSPGPPATCELQDRVTPHAHSPLHPGTGDLPSQPPLCLRQRSKGIGDVGVCSELAVTSSDLPC